MTKFKSPRNLYKSLHEFSFFIRLRRRLRTITPLCISDQLF